MANAAEPIIHVEENKTAPRRMAALESVAYWTGVGAVVAAGLAAALGIFAWYFADKLADQRKTDFDTFKQQSETETARLNERAAKFEKEAADSLLEVQRLKEKMSWREISEKDKQDFIALVASAPKGKIAMTYLTNNEEVMSFAIQLSDLFRSAGYDAPLTLKDMTSLFPIGGAMVGVVIAVKSSTDPIAGTLQQGLNRIGIDAGGELRPNQPEDVVVLVGSKPTKK